MASDDLLDFIAAWEGWKATPSQDAIATRFTDIGHGHVLTQADRYHPVLGRFFDADGNVQQAAPLTREEGRALLAADLDVYAECVNEATKSFALSDNELDAAYSLAYNIGCQAFRESTLARRLAEGNVWAAADEWPRWNRAGGRIVPGLVRRRNAELRIFMDADYEARP